MTEQLTGPIPKQTEPLRLRLSKDGGVTWQTKPLVKLLRRTQGRGRLIWGVIAAEEFDLSGSTIFFAQLMLQDASLHPDMPFVMRRVAVEVTTVDGVARQAITLERVPTND
jgi:hypothetical protein